MIKKRKGSEICVSVQNVVIGLYGGMRKTRDMNVLIVDGIHNYRRKNAKAKDTEE